MDDAALFTRLKAICCDVWKIPPWEFDEAAEQDKVAAEDIFEALAIKAGQPLGFNVRDFLLREAKAAKEKKADQVLALYKRLRIETDPERREALEAQINKLNRW